MQSVASIARSWTSGVRPDIHGMSEKYSSRNNKTFLTALRFFEVSDCRGTDVSSEYAARVLKRRLYLHFDGDGQIWDGKRVDPVEMGLIDEYPDKGDTWTM